MFIRIQLPLKKSSVYPPDAFVHDLLKDVSTHCIIPKVCVYVTLAQILTLPESQKNKQMLQVYFLQIVFSNCCLNIGWP